MAFFYVALRKEGVDRNIVAMKRNIAGLGRPPQGGRG